MLLSHATSHSTIPWIIVCIVWSSGWGSHYTNYWYSWVQTIYNVTGIITKKLTGLNIILKCFWASLRSCTEHDLTRERVDHLLSQLEGSDYLEQCEGMTGHSQWLLVQNTVPVPLTWKEWKGKNHWKLWWSNVCNMLSNFMWTSLHLQFICSSMCLFMFNTVKALISGHQWDVKKVSVTRADRLWGWLSKEATYGSLPS